MSNSIQCFLSLLCALAYRPQNDILLYSWIPTLVHILTYIYKSILYTHAHSHTVYRFCCCCRCVQQNKTLPGWHAHDDDGGSRNIQVACWSPSFYIKSMRAQFFLFSFVFTARTHTHTHVSIKGISKFELFSTKSVFLMSTRSCIPAIYIYTYIRLCGIHFLFICVDSILKHTIAAAVILFRNHIIIYY